MSNIHIIVVISIPQAGFAICGIYFSLMTRVADVFNTADNKHKRDDVHASSKYEKKQIGHFNFKEKEKRLLVPYERLGTNPQPRGVT